MGTDTHVGHRQAHGHLLVVRLQLGGVLEQLAALSIWPRLARVTPSATFDHRHLEEEGTVG